MFSVICLETLLPTTHEDAASYESAGTKTIDRDSTIDDVCDFVVEYINSDVLVCLYITDFAIDILYYSVCKGAFVR